MVLQALVALWCAREVARGKEKRSDLSAGKIPLAPYLSRCLTERRVGIHLSILLNIIQQSTLSQHVCHYLIKVLYAVALLNEFLFSNMFSVLPMVPKETS